MSDTFIPTKADIQTAMTSPKAATLKKEFLISKDALYDYYSTNSGMLAKNPSIGGAGGGDDEGGGEGGDDPSEEIQGLKNRMSAVEETQDKQKEAAEKSRQILEDGYIEADNVEEIDNLISNQDILRKSQQNLLSTF